MLLLSRCQDLRAHSSSYLFLHLQLFSAFHVLNSEAKHYRDRSKALPQIADVRPVGIIPLGPPRSGALRGQCLELVVPTSLPAARARNLGDQPSVGEGRANSVSLKVGNT